MVHNFACKDHPILAIFTSDVRGIFTNILLFVAIKIFYYFFSARFKIRKSNQGEIIMNKKVTKLLSKYASVSDTSLKELKKWWHTLNWQEKTAERERMEAVLAGEAEEAEEEEETA
jgi:hypothetical protein